MTSKYRLVAIDLDGTIVDRDGAIIRGAAEAIRSVLARGIAVTLATGRMYQPTSRFAAELNISVPLICYQGALIREPRDGEVLWHKPLPGSLARSVLDQIRCEGLHRYAYIDGAIYVEQRREDDSRYARHNGVELHLVDDLVALLERQPTELAARGDAAEVESLMARIRMTCGADVIVNKIHTSFCEIAHGESGKGNALKYLAGWLGVPQSQTVAIGDSPNDVSMLEWAGLGIVVGDAPSEVRAAADWVVSNGAEDSFSEAIARLLDHNGH
jgi:Cof subfamily protein (haloacid dehalogenase superfamily)